MGRKRGEGSPSQSKRAKRGSSSQAPSSSSNRPPIYPIKFPNAADRQIFTRLTDRTLRSTKFYYPCIYNHLNIDSIVRQMASNLELSEFLNVRKPSYDQLTLESLSMFNISRDSDRGVLTIQAHLFNQVKTLSFDKLCDTFGMDSSAPCDAPSRTI